MILINWHEVSIKTDKPAVDEISDILMDCGAGGVSIEDPEMVIERIRENSWDAYEFPEELLNRDFVLIKAYFPAEANDNKLTELRRRMQIFNTEIMPGSVRELNFSEVQEEDWANSWKAYYKPVKAGSRVVIKPTWENYEPAEGELVVELDPGMAFGTGTHPTTVMCIKSLEKLITGGERVFDIGTGSGILAITAAKLGAAGVTAVDIDEVAVRSAAANVALNNVEDRVSVFAGNLLDNVKGQADLVVANIVADIIKLVCPDAAKAVKVGGTFLASGIIAPRGQDVIEAVEQAGFVIRETIQEGDWLCLLACKED